jgi:hypothetical protein
MFAVRTTRRFAQDELVWAVLSGNVSENPIKRNLRIVGMTVLAGFNELFSLLRRGRIDCD